MAACRGTEDGKACSRRCLVDEGWLLTSTVSMKSNPRSCAPKAPASQGPNLVLSQFSYSVISALTVAWVRYPCLTHCSSWLLMPAHAATVNGGPLSIITFLIFCASCSQI